MMLRLCVCACGIATDPDLGVVGVVDELVGDVLAASLHISRHVSDALPVSAWAVGVRSSWRGVCDASRGHYSRPLIGSDGVMQDAGQLVTCQRVAVFEDDVLVDANNSIASLLTAEDGSGCTC